MEDTLILLLGAFVCFIGVVVFGHTEEPSGKPTSHVELARFFTALTFLAIFAICSLGLLVKLSFYLVPALLRTFGIW